jgi:outer membrane protein OmpA-like peptidoglycan-associated protein
MRYSPSTLLPVLLLFVLHNHAVAQSEDDVVSSEDIVKSLQQPEKPKTRSLRAVRVQAKPKVDLKIPFEYNSSALAPEAELQLEELSNALQGESLATYRFEIAGHTDASGSSEYNRDLSDRRADTVRQFLVGKGVGAERLDTIGHGEDKLLLADDPMHADNRRVEITNLGVATKE